MQVWPAVSGFRSFRCSASVDLPHIGSIQEAPAPTSRRNSFLIGLMLNVHALGIAHARVMIGSKGTVEWSVGFGRKHHPLQAILHSTKATAESLVEAFPTGGAFREQHFKMMCTSLGLISANTLSGQGSESIAKLCGDCAFG